MKTDEKLELTSEGKYGLINPYPFSAKGYLLLLTFLVIISFIQEVVFDLKLMQKQLLGSYLDSSYFLLLEGCYSQQMAFLYELFWSILRLLPLFRD